jgi:formylmethanofuran dehydrogenase subunit E
MKADAVAKNEEKNVREILICSGCERVITDPRESVRSRKSVMCVACYESLLNPFEKCCSGGAAI